jgi:phosphoglycolate phosphatase-like HAD superfamily hydrolase
MTTLILSDRHIEIDAVGLDIDGVLRDTGHEAYGLFCKTTEELGGRAPSYHDFVHSYTGSAFYKECGVTAGADEIVATFRKHLGDTMPSPFPDVAGALQRLAAMGLKIFVVSASRQERTHIWFRDHGIAEHFHHVKCESKDKTDCIKAACLELGVEPGRACYVGDMGSDMRQAAAAGAIPIGMTRGYGSDAALQGCGAAMVIPTLEHLFEFTT